MKITVSVDRAQSSFNETEQVYEIKLTSEELRLAYEEKQHINHKTDILNWLDDNKDNSPSKFKRYVKSNLDQIAQRLCDTLDNGVLGFADAREWVMNRTAEEYNKTLLITNERN